MSHLLLLFFVVDDAVVFVVSVVAGEEEAGGERGRPRGPIAASPDGGILRHRGHVETAVPPGGLLRV